MKINFLLWMLFFNISLYAQVGINTQTPKATLDIAASPTDNNKIDGIIAPRLKGSEIKAKGSLYTSEQEAAIVYITEPLDASATDDKTTNVTSIGYFYFDKNLGTSGRWVRIENEKPVTFFKSSSNQYVASTLNNNPGTNITATFTNTDSLINQATIFDPSTSYFTLLKDGLYEFTGTICFNPGRWSGNDSEGHGALVDDERVIINVLIQFSTNNGSSWNGITGMRMIYNTSNGDLNIPISTPVALRKLNAGTLIRLVLNRPNIQNNEVAGTDSTTGNPTTYQNINQPTGLDFTKLIKIQQIQ